MKHISELSGKDLEPIKLIVFDVDGVLVRRGTKIKTEGDFTSFEIKRIHPDQIEQMRHLKERGYSLNINSGRGLYVLQEMFRDVLPYTSLTYENGSSSWYRGKIYQHINSFNELNGVSAELRKISHENIKGYELKEFIITVHCHDRVSGIEKLLEEHKNLYCLWNGEAYDIGINNTQTKGMGVKMVTGLHGMKKENVMAIGDNYNDIQLLENSGLKITADKSRLPGDFYVELLSADGRLPADVMMEQVLKNSNCK
ncbi:MAG: HAD family hydrolase [Nanobdellota archaeon]